MVRRNASVFVDADVSGFERGLARATAAAKGFSKELDTTNNRTSMLVQSVLALGPALVPLGAQAVPMLSGLATQMAFAGAAAGTTVLAFSGIGDALKAVNDQAVEPTAAHLKKMEETLNELGPAGGEFVLYLQKLRPELQRLQDTAQAGMLPGAREGIEQLMVLLPEVQHIVGTVATTMGDLFRDAGDNLNDPRWREFFEYIDQSAQPILTEMGRTTGNLIEGLANMMMAFDPLSRDFSASFLQMSEDFSKWSAGLEDSKSFQSFVDYIETSGPQVWETLGAITDALIELTKATAPVGQVVLKVLETMADTLSVIAKSKAGPTLIGIAAALAAVSRVMAVGRILGGSAILSTLGTLGAPTTVTNIKKLGAPLSDIGTRFYRMGQSAEYASAKTLAARESTKALGGAVLRTGGLVAGFALMQSGLAEKTGLSNTASLALMGTMAGPWGAAFGGAAGLVMDVAASNNALMESTDQLNKVFGDSVVDLGAWQSTLDAHIKKTKEYQAGIKDAITPGGGTGSFVGDLKQGWTALEDIVTRTGKKMSQADADNAALMGAAKINVNKMNDMLNPNDKGNKLLDMTNKQLDVFVTQATPAAISAGLDLQKVLTTGVGMPELVAAIRVANPSLDTMAGRSRVVSDAIDVQRGIVSDLTLVTDVNSDGVKNNTDLLLANIDAMNKKSDATLAAFDAETAYQRALDTGADRDKERKKLEKELRQAKADGEKERASIRRDAAEAGADTSGDMAASRDNLAAARGKLAVAKTDAQRAAARKSIATSQKAIDDKQVGSSRAARDAGERLQESLDRQAETVARIKDELSEYTLTLDKTTKAGQANRDIISGMAGAWNALDAKAQNAPGKFEKTREALIKQAQHFGLTRKAAERYIDKLKLDIPPRILTKIMLEKQHAEAMLKKFAEAFDNLDGKVAKTFIETQIEHVTGPDGKLDRATRGGKKNRAAAGSFAGGGYTGSGGKYEAAGVVHRGEFVHTAETTATFRPLFEAIHRGTMGLSNATAIARAQSYDTRGYAGGGYVTGAGIDYDRLAGAVIAARPLYGDVHVKDGTDFRRQLRNDQAARSGGGVTF